MSELTPDTGIDLERFRAGDPDLFRELVTVISPRLQRAIRSYSSDDDDAEDLLQECWVRIYRKRAKFSGRGSFFQWALVVSRNVCKMERRGKSPLTRVSLEDQGEIRDLAPGPVDQMRSHRRAAVLYSALAGLREREQRAIALRLLEGRPTAEVAFILGVKEVSVRSLIHRGLQKLRAMDSLMELMLEAGGE